MYFMAFVMSASKMHKGEDARSFSKEKNLVPYSRSNLVSKKKKRKDRKMEKYICTVCGYVYDPEEHDGVKFEDLPDDYVCPLCGVGKDLFEEQ